MNAPLIALAVLASSALLAACGGGSGSSPAPTVTISVSPTNVTAGKSATLTWLSTNATTCTASGAWSGSQPTTGNATVAPSVAGTETYTLACTGSGGSVSQSATLTAYTLPLSLQTPPGFSPNYKLLAMSGASGLPLAFTTFNNQYVEGGFGPTGGAEINVASETLPPPPLTNFVNAELTGEGAAVTSQSSTTVSRTTCIKTLYTTPQGATVEKNVAVYCPSGQSLYKFFLSYNTGDPNESQYLSSFDQVLGNVTFPQ